MFFKRILMFLYGYYEIEIEGMFLQRFVNLCKSKSIAIIDSKIMKSTVLKLKVLIEDFEDIKDICLKTNSIYEIKKEKGLPLFIKKYKKRKGFAIAILAIAIFIYINSLFIWNIDINLNGEFKNVSNEKIEELLKENEIKMGTLKSKVNIKSLQNKIYLNFEEISWMDIDIKGTNLILNAEKIVEKIEDDDKDVLINTNQIIADKSGVIKKITVYSGTKMKNAGEQVSVGDILVIGEIEGKYLGKREVFARADIVLENQIKYEKECTLEIEEKEKTGNVQKNVEFYINNFKINLHKSLLNFENYDTIRESRKLKLFSNYYLPIEIVIYRFEEMKSVKKIYTKEELESKMLTEIKEEFENQYDVSSFENIEIDKKSILENGKLKLTVVYNVQEKIKAK